jgi:ABC-2 type transport system ATP-binding protein
VAQNSIDDVVIDLRDVAKTYGRKVHALRGIELLVRRGEIFGLLGPNGAGKTTLVKIAMAVIRPTRAAGTLLGRPLGHKPTLAKVGYLPEHHRFPPYLTGRQALEFFAALAKVDRQTRQRRAGELLDLVGLGKWADAKVGTYSKGMQQRIALAQALVNDPQLVVLDEPTDGLDPVGRKEVRDILRRLCDQGKTVFLNSHLLGEVERICDRVAILVDGQVIRQGTVDELTAKSQRYEIEIASGPAEDLRAAIRAALPCELAICLPGVPSGRTAGPPVETGRLPSGEAVELVGATLRIITGDPARIQPVIDAFRGRGLTIQAVRPLRQSLEEFFIEMVSDADPGRPAAQLPAKGGPP